MRFTQPHLPFIPHRVPFHDDDPDKRYHAKNNGKTEEDGHSASEVVVLETQPDHTDDQQTRYENAHQCLASFKKSGFIHLPAQADALALDIDLSHRLSPAVPTDDRKIPNDVTQFFGRLNPFYSLMTGMPQQGFLILGNAASPLSSRP
jgi:hypothetical protein